ncbi:MAG TPA: O-methyltransferase [candidate division Zixibacteria bacterium]|nr:O-methyltransferase [candidate division Zixibacteria bacterium]
MPEMFQKIHKYLEQSVPDRPPILREMEQYARENEFPIIGPLVGRFLYQMALLTKARKILELGSGYGYSAFWFSLATRSKGNIVMTDTQRENKRRAFDYFKRAGLQSQFTFLVGDALRVIKKLDGQFDIILNDIDKIDYPRTIDVAASLLRKGGLFITDNVIWSGRVCEKKQDDTTKAIVRFTEALNKDSRFFTTVMPVRDGISVSLRL